MQGLTAVVLKIPITRMRRLFMNFDAIYAKQSLKMFWRKKQPVTQALPGPADRVQDRYVFEMVRERIKAALDYRLQAAKFENLVLHLSSFMAFNSIFHQNYYGLKTVTNPALKSYFWIEETLSVSQLRRALGAFPAIPPKLENFWLHTRW